MVENLQALLGVTIPMQFEPVITVAALLFMLFIVSFFAEMLKLIILRR